MFNMNNLNTFSISIMTVKKKITYFRVARTMS